MDLIPVAEALQRLLEGVGPTRAERVPLAEAGGRTLASDLAATRTQPPFSASAMDGYAVRAGDLANIPCDLKVIGEAPAGHGFSGTVNSGEAVRIFTGAPLPQGADTILIQENAERAGDVMTAKQGAALGTYVRPAGLDFDKGDVLLKAGAILDYRALALAAAMNHAQVSLRRRPRVAVLATGDELVEPGEEPGPDQIVASNQYGIAALVEACGGEARRLGISRDSQTEIAGHVREALSWNADVLVTLGGASVGDHDLVQATLGNEGMELSFWRIAMRPGKPLMAGHLGPMRVLGLPGNPVSSLVCGHLFLRPLLAALLGRLEKAERQEQAILAAPLAENDRRQDYLRARLHHDEAGVLVATPFVQQDSSVLSCLAAADGLIVRAPHAPALKAGDTVAVIRF
ncbi:molybdopterin molybdotransferase [Breoghania corrubedonensis]|uniref:Molybdopterin molybdenumtransferase n=1 Tax=Breoghania corrubedonensis TaxID=665038 RepID=A0A2T5VBL9_9HYPH|nr:gephyrin-like molybdotransferase Glp [Breoghania corrubedonensis]PTW61155.1 molybdopterin molybdotransferase [Breoghania corrubedonensis]